MRSVWHEPGYQHPYPLHNKVIVSEDGDIIWWTANGWSKPLGEDTSSIGVRWALLTDVIKQSALYIKAWGWLKSLITTTDEFCQEDESITTLHTDMAILLRALKTAQTDLEFNRTYIEKEYPPSTITVGAAVKDVADSVGIGDYSHHANGGDDE